MNIGGFFKDIEYFGFAIFWFLKLAFEIVEGHHFFSLFFIEIEDDKVVELCFLIIFDIELSFF